MMQPKLRWVFGAAAATFIALAVAIAMGKPVFFDIPTMDFLGGVRSPWLTILSRLVSDLASTPAITLVLLVIATILATKRQYSKLVFVAVGLGGAEILNAILKLTFGRPRPTHLTHLVVETGLSFPSGHTMMSTALALTCLYLLWENRWRWQIFVLAVAYIIAVGVSRIYLGVHYPSDVLAGWCASTLWIGAAVYLTKPLRIAASPPTIKPD